MNVKKTARFARHQRCRNVQDEEQQECGAELGHDAKQPNYARDTEGDRAEAGRVVGDAEPVQEEATDVADRLPSGSERVAAQRGQELRDSAVSAGRALR